MGTCDLRVRRWVVRCKHVRRSRAENASQHARCVVRQGGRTNGCVGRSSGVTATASIRIIFARRRGPRGERRRWHLQIRDSAKRKKTIAGRQQTKDVVVDWKKKVDDATSRTPTFLKKGSRVSNLSPVVVLFRLVEAGLVRELGQRDGKTQLRSHLNSDWEELNVDLERGYGR